MPPSNPSTELRDCTRAPRPRRFARRVGGWLHSRGGAARGGGLGDAGSAALEFIVVGLVLLVPTVYLVITLGLIQGQALGVQAGARHLARTIATSPDAAAAGVNADAVIGSVVAEYGLDASTVTVDTRCLPATGACPQAGATLVVTVTARVPLPLVPPVLGLERIASIPVQATSAQKVSRFWETG